ncbi:UNVERIFIED_CONTAM: hypothetical protein FKN15_031593 [Acipenser sinensis]
MQEDELDCDNVKLVAEVNEDLTKLLKYKVYKRRWFILLVICILNSSNAMLWLSFAPVADQTAKYFELSLDQVNWLSLIFLVVAIPVGFGTTWMLDTLGLRTSLGIYTIPAAIVCLLATAGIRNRVPPTPSSSSALASSSEPFLAGVKLLVRNKPYMILLTCFGAGIGIFTSFSTLLQQILCVKGYSNDLAGLCGALFVVFGILGAFLLGLYVDRTKKFIEVTKISFCLAALASIAFAVVSQMRTQGIAVAVVSSLFGMFGFAIYPISMELAVECSYPIGEATSAGLIFISG